MLIKDLWRLKKVLTEEILSAPGTACPEGSAVATPSTGSWIWVISPILWELLEAQARDGQPPLKGHLQRSEWGARARGGGLRVWKWGANGS